MSLKHLSPDPLTPFTPHLPLPHHLFINISLLYTLLSYHKTYQSYHTVAFLPVYSMFCLAKTCPTSRHRQWERKKVLQELHRLHLFRHPSSMFFSLFTLLSSQLPKSRSSWQCKKGIFLTLNHLSPPSYTFSSTSLSSIYSWFLHYIHRYHHKPSSHEICHHCCIHYIITPKQYLPYFNVKAVYFHTGGSDRYHQCSELLSTEDSGI